MDINLKNIRPYGDTSGDGAVQLSFTLPMKCNSVSREAAKIFVKKMGFEHVEVVHDVEIGENFTFFIVYGKTSLSVDASDIQSTEVKTNVWDRETCNNKIKEYFDRKLIVIGACIGEDAHTVGIDAVMNMKGYAGHYGLERYSMIETYNMGAQILPETLLTKAIEVNADAILVSQVVTQKDIHLKNLTKMIELADASNIRNKTLLIAGGPRVDNNLATELGYDAGFGKGSFAENVASFIIQELHNRQLKKITP